VSCGKKKFSLTYLKQLAQGKFQLLNGNIREISIFLRIMGHNSSTENALKSNIKIGLPFNGP
jgi:hypothetical protein